MPDKIEKRAIIDVRLETDKARQAAIALKTEIVRLEGEQKKLNKSLRDAIKKKDIDAQKKYATQLTKVQTELKRARTEFNQYTKEVNKGNEIFKRSGGLTKSLTSAFTSLGVQIISVYAAYRLLKTAVVGSINAFMEFEKTLVNVQTLLKYNERTLRRGALEILPKYGLAIKDVNRALFDAISAGIPATESVEFLHEAALLAVGGVTDLRTAVDGLTTVLNTWSLSSEHAKEVADAFYVAQKYGKTTVEQLVNQIGRVAPIAQAASLSFQEMLGSLASLTKGGLNTEESVTILRQVIAALIKPAHQASLVLKDASVPTGLLAIKTKGLVFALEQLNQVYRENPDAISGMIPNIRAMTGVYAFNEERLIELKKIIGEVETDTTSLTRAYDEQMATLQKRWDVAKSSIKAYQILVGNVLSPVLKRVLKHFNEWVDISRSQIDLTMEARHELKKEFEILLKGNFTLEQRSLALKSLSERYAKYLPDLDIEKTSLEDIKQLQAEIILQLAGRIMYMKYEHALGEAIESRIDAIERLMDIEDAETRIKEGGYLLSIKFSEREQDFLKENSKIIKQHHIDWLMTMEEKDKTYDDLNDKHKDIYRLMLLSAKAYSQGFTQDTKQITETIKAEYSKLFAAMGLDLDEWIENLQKAAKEEIDAMKGLGLIEKTRLAALHLSIRRKLQRDELALLEDGYNKEIALEELRYAESLMDLKANIITEEKLARALFADEIKANEETYALLEEMEEYHVRKQGEIEIKWQKKNEENIRQLRKKYGLGTIEELRAIEMEGLIKSKAYALLSEKEKLEALSFMRKKWQDEDEKKEEAAAKAIVRFKKKWGLDSLKELRDLEIAEFESSTEYLLLSTEEQEKAKFNIRKKYLDDYIDMAIDMAADLANMIMNFEMERKSRQYDHEMELLRNAKDAESQILKNKLDKDLITEEGYKAAQDALAEKHERKRIALEKEKFEQDKKHAISQVIIAGIIAAMRVIAEYWGTPKAWQMAVVIGATTLFQTALISAQKYAAGGITDFKEGLLRGLGTWNSDNILGALSPGEIILNAKVGANPALRAQASAINVAAGGIPFADGGMAARSISSEVDQSFVNVNQIRAIVESMPPQIVLVKDITTGIERVVRVEERANV